MAIAGMPLELSSECPKMAVTIRIATAPVLYGVFFDEM